MHYSQYRNRYNTGSLLNINSLSEALEGFTLSSVPLLNDSSNVFCSLAGLSLLELLLDGEMASALRLFGAEFVFCPGLAPVLVRPDLVDGILQCA